MRPSTPAGPHTLSLTLRGPEYAVVLPHGDSDALLDVCRNLSDLWNGSGTLLIPVKEDGSPVSCLIPDLTILTPDQFLVHPTVGTAAAEAAMRRWRAARWSEAILQLQVHSWWVVRDAEMHDKPLAMPAPSTPAEELLAAVLWGYIDPANMGEVRKQFLPVDVPDDELLVKLFEAQLTGESPLSWGARYMAPTLSLNGPHWRTLHVLPENPVFDDLVSFWNLRARYPTMSTTPLFGGIPVDALSQPQRSAAAINEWLARPPGAHKPDLVVDTREEEVQRVHTGLQAVGLTHVESSAWTTGSIPDDRRDPEYTLAQTGLPMRLERGLSADMLSGLHDGVNKVRLPIPTEFPARLSWVGRVTAVVGGLPRSVPDDRHPRTGLVDTCGSPGRPTAGRGQLLA